MCIYDILGSRGFMYKHTHFTLKISKCPSLPVIDGVALWHGSRAIGVISFRFISDAGHRNIDLEHCQIQIFHGASEI